MFRQLKRLLRIQRKKDLPISIQDGPGKLQKRCIMVSYQNHKERVYIRFGSAALPRSKPAYRRGQTDAAYDNLDPSCRSDPRSARKRKR